MTAGNIVGTWSSWAPRLQSLLRMVAAFMFIVAGSMKLFAFPAGIPPDGGTVPLMSQLGVGAMLEVFGGALLLVGFFTRPVAFLLSGEMAVAYFQFHFPRGFWPTMNNGVAAALYCFVWLYFSAAGAGPWSLDTRMSRSAGGRQEGSSMRSLLFLCIVLALAVAGCVVPPPAGTPAPPSVTVLPADARALQYGASAGEVFAHPTLGPSVRALFGADWGPGTGARPTLGAPEFFSRSGPIRMLRIGETDYIAVTGCRAQSCQGHQGLLLIRQGGGELLGRLEEGGFIHYYGHGAGMEMTPERRALLEAAWRAASR